MDKEEKWRIDNRDYLIKCGIPMEIVDDDDRFWRFVDTGEHFHRWRENLEWSISDLTREQVEDLYELFFEFLPDARISVEMCPLLLLLRDHLENLGLKV